MCISLCVCVICLEWALWRHTLPSLYFVSPSYPGAWITLAPRTLSQYPEDLDSWEAVLLCAPVSWAFTVWTCCSTECGYSVLHMLCASFSPLVKLASKCLPTTTWAAQHKHDGLLSVAAKSTLRGCVSWFTSREIKVILKRFSRMVLTSMSCGMHSLEIFCPYLWHAPLWLFMRHCDNLEMVVAVN